MSNANDVKNSTRIVDDYDDKEENIDKNETALVDDVNTNTRIVDDYNDEDIDENVVDGEVPSTYSVNEDKFTEIETDLEPDGAVDRAGCIDSVDSRLNKYSDNSHHYFSILRQDFLDYDLDKQVKTKKDFISFRRFQGKVVSQKSVGITYVECTAYRVKPSDIKVCAYDLKTNKRLKVIILDLDTNKKSSYFPIFIYFPNMLHTGDKFDISFSVVLPNELKVLDVDDRMSICLGRINCGVDKLIFNVCLDFEPTLVTVSKHEARDFDKNELSLYFIEDNLPTVEKYTNCNEYERYEISVGWGTKVPFIIRWECEKPTAFLYAINYSC